MQNASTRDARSPHAASAHLSCSAIFDNDHTWMEKKEIVVNFLTFLQFILGIAQAKHATNWTIFSKRKRHFRLKIVRLIGYLELNLIMYSLCVFFQFNFLNCLELASLFRTVDDFEPFSGKIVLFQSMANHSKPNLAGKVTHVTPKTFRKL